MRDSDPRENSGQRKKKKGDLISQGNAAMCTYLACLTGLLAALLLAEPVSCEEVEKPGAPAPSLCPLVRSAAEQTQLEAEASARLQEAERLSARELDVPSFILLQAPSPAESPALRRDRILFESFLVNWLFIEDLAPEQQAIMQKFLARCGVAADGLSNGERLGDALGLLQELVDIQGENSALPSDHQFQLIARLAPDALQKLDRAASFLKGENHMFHKDYPISFRQFRRIGLHGQEAGLHFCLTRDAFRTNSHRLSVWAVALG
ncbi:MAG: hypothetical protein DMG42_18575 [Acidobacteria bacterium]|nr:MAG: hypothetical protein DMG42_18575 [Acidobacteriota bacterium]